jgi:hypothetical protein
MPLRPIQTRIVLLALLLAGTVFANSANRLDWNSTVKLTSLASEGGDLQLLGHLRLDLRYSQADWLDAAVAYEQRAHWWSHAVGATGLPAIGHSAYRLRQLDWSISESDDAFYRHEIDRAYLAFHPTWGEVTIGRQAIGLGRGALFSAVDFFAPFSPVEADREWRRGVDGVRLEYGLSATSSAELIAVFGERAAESATLLRLRGYLGPVDAEILVGERARDEILAGIISAAVGEAEVHAEFASVSGALSAVIGGSHTFDIGDGLTVLAEYHYSGLGASDSRDIDSELRSRLLRGDLQILGRQALGLQAAYPLTDLLSGSLGLLASPSDGSGLLMPTLRYDLSSRSSAIATAYLPWGKRDSEFGDTTGLFLQLGLYF